MSCPYVSSAQTSMGVPVNFVNSTQLSLVNMLGESPVVVGFEAQRRGCVK